MIAEDQAAVIECLAASSTHGGSNVERIDTHASIVLLAGDRAYKLKRAVRFDYLDFSTAERRHALCEAEVRLNRRTAPTLYRGVVAVTRDADGSYALDGTGTPVDWVVEMNRFPGEALFDRLAATGTLSLELMPPLAAAIAEFHSSAEQRRDCGGRAGMSWVIEGNAAGFAEFGRGCFDPWDTYRVTDRSCRELDRCAELLERRREDGFVRQCHGDLHLRNIVLLNGRPTLFDGVEFNDDISCTDVLYDLAFLLMDLWRRTLPRHANGLEPLPVGDGGSCRDFVAAAVSILPRCGSRQDQRHSRPAATRRAAADRASDGGPRVPDDGRPAPPSAAAVPDRGWRSLRIGEIDARARAGTAHRGRPRSGRDPERRNTETSLWSATSGAARTGRILAARLPPRLQHVGGARRADRAGWSQRRRRRGLRPARRS